MIELIELRINMKLESRLNQFIFSCFFFASYFGFPVLPSLSLLLSRQEIFPLPHHSNSCRPIVGVLACVCDTTKTPNFTS